MADPGVEKVEAQLVNLTFGGQAERISLAQGAFDLFDESVCREFAVTDALESVKHGIPQALLINGHNPLLLLHNALSDGVHGRSDAGNPQKLMAVAERLPSLPSRRRGLECPDKVGRRLGLTLVQPGLVAAPRHTKS
ncbi:MAG TPA: hypothetical protein VGL91_19155 [Acidobacteriota bacterium]